MNIVDICIILIVAGSAYWGSKKRAVTQVSILIGVIVGLIVASLAYNRLAFLTQNSSLRGIVLAVSILAIGFLTCDFVLTLGRRLRHRLPWDKKPLLLAEKIISGVVSSVMTLLIIWLVIGVFGVLLPAVVRHQIKTAWAYSNLEDALPYPEAVRRAAALLQPFRAPEIFVGQEPSFDGQVSVVDTFENLDDAVAGASPSVLRINAWGCGSTSAGTGFLTSNKRTIVTNAHVVAGANRITAQDGRGTYTAHVLSFDPRLDIAVLTISSDAAGNPLVLSAQAAAPGQIAAVVGYPAGNDLTTEDAIVVQQLRAEGYDIYGKDKITRDIFALRAQVVPGNSGSPLVGASGKVAGVVVGHSDEQNRTGYAIVANQVESSVAAALVANQVVSTGSCTDM